jgi:hypothetical protein
VTTEEREVFGRIANHLGDANVLMRELKDAVATLPERISIVQPPARVHRTDLAWIVAGALLGGLVGASVAMAAWG